MSLTNAGIIISKPRTPPKRIIQSPGGKEGKHAKVTMLSKPGEARSNTTPGGGTYRGNRKAISIESPDDIVRRLQRVPSNKACADCSSKVRS